MTASIDTANPPAKMAIAVDRLARAAIDENWNVTQTLAGSATLALTYGYERDKVELEVFIACSKLLTAKR